MMASAALVSGIGAGVGLGNVVSTSGSAAASVGDASGVPVTSRRSRVSAVKATSFAKPLSFSGALVFDPLVARPLTKTSRGVVRGSGARAEADSERPEDEKAIAPLVPESPTGQFLVSILRSHPHLFPAAADQQLERLAADKEAALRAEQQESTSTELALYKRIKEVKDDERRKAIEEVMYALIVQKFVEGGISLVAKIPSASSGSATQVEVVAQDRELEAVHSVEALEMVREHLAVVLGGRGTSSFLDQHTIAHISKLRVGQVYAASIMYGYFLRKVDQRFQLEKTMKGMLGAGETVETETGTTFQLTDDDRPAEAGTDSLAAEAAAAIASFQAAQTREGQELGGTPTNAVPPGMKPSKLRSYVMSFDPETLQNCATMKARESLNVIEKQAEALFGKPEIKVGPDGTFKVVSDDTIKVSFSGLRRLVLEAVAFGSYLWDVETLVDSQYNLIRH